MNIVINGNFSDGTTGWSSSASSLAVSNNILSITASGAQVFGRAVQDTGLKPSNGDKVYVRMLMKVTNSNCTGISFYVRDGSGGTVLAEIVQSSPANGTLYKLHGIATIGALVNNHFIIPSHTYADAATANGKVAELTKVFAKILTSEEASMTAADLDKKYPYWFDSMKSVETVKNLVQNGNFELGTAGWSVIGGFTPTVSNGVCSFTATAQNSRVQQQIQASIGDIIYRAAWVKSNSALIGLADATAVLKAHSGSGNFELLSNVRTESIANRYVSVIDTRATAWTETQFKNCVVINLTERFGAGNEPDAATCDVLFPDWFDGTEYVNELKYNNQTWAEWTIAGAGTTKGANGLHLVSATPDESAYIATSLKGSTKYGLLYTVKANTTTAGDFKMTNALTGVSAVLSKTVGKCKATFTTQATIATNQFNIYLDSTNPLGTYVDLEAFRMIELPSGSQIESDFANLTADQLNVKYPYVYHGGVKYPYCPVEIESVGKNLINQITGETTVIGTKPMLIMDVKPSTQYTFMGYNTGSSFTGSLEKYEKINGTWTKTSSITFASGPQTTFTTGADTRQIAIDGLTNPALRLAQLELGSAATPYVPYTSNLIRLPAPGASLPNGTCDEVYSMGKIEQNVKEYMLQASDIDLLYTSYSNVDVVYSSTQCLPMRRLGQIQQWGCSIYPTKTRFCVLQ
jgi:hypothetical protein